MSTFDNISREQLVKLRDRYLELIKEEVELFGVKPTELRHLIGRLGEFECALHVGGTLAHRANQNGFDVVCSKGRRVSVKATAQKTGFVAIGKNTLHLADDLMVLQYVEGRLELLYYGCINEAVKVCRTYDGTGTYELDIAKARKLGA